MVASALLAMALTASAAHPHLFFGSSDVPQLRSAAATSHQSIANHFNQIVSAHLGDPTPTVTDYGDPRFLGAQVAVWAFAYQLTGNTAYADKAKSILFTYLGWTDWTFGESTGEDLNAAHMLLGVSCAYDWLYGYLSATEQAQVATRLGAEAAKMAAAMPTEWWNGEYVQNHHWIDTASIGLAGLALSGEDSRADGWVSLATQELAKVQSVLGRISDGSFHEGGPYQVYGLSFALPFWTALARTGVDYTDMGILRGFGAFRLGSLIPELPQEMLLPYGDFTGWPTQATVEVLRFAAGRFGDAAAEAAAQKWLASGRTRSLPELWYELFEFLYYDPSVQPLPQASWPLDSRFADLQATVLKSSWNSGDLHLGFKAGPYGGRANFDRLATGGAPGGWLAWGHDHNDDMSFWLFGSGVWLAPEAMGYDAGKNTTSTNPANQTAYHNGLLVDGQGELGDVRASDTNWNNPWFFGRDATPLLAPGSTADYSITSGRGARLFDPALGLSRWDRLIVLARHRYALVHDDLAAASAHAYDWICHFSDGANVDTASGWVEGIAKNGQALGVRVIAPSSWTATTGAQTASEMSKFDPDGSTAWVRVRPSASAAAAQFLTALWPTTQAAWASRPRIDALSSTAAGAGAVVAPGSTLEERWIFGDEGGLQKTAGDLQLTSALLGMVGRNQGLPVRAALFGAGAIADQGGARVLLSSQSARSIEADLQGTTLVVSGDGIADFRAYAPGAAKATINGIAVSVVLEGDFVSYGGGVVGGSPGGGTSGGGSSGGGSSSAGGSVPTAGVATSSLSKAGCAGTGEVGVLCALAGAAAASFLARRRKAERAG